MHISYVLGRMSDASMDAIFFAKLAMTGMTGFEPATNGSASRCAIQVTPHAQDSTFI